MAATRPYIRPVAAPDAAVTCVASFALNLPSERALGLFTPEGERDWVDGWDPAYPGGEPVLGPPSEKPPHY